MPLSTLPELPEWFWYPITFLYGAFVGSFLNVLIYRLPLGLSVSSPPSHCPRCNNYLRPWDNIPLFAFLSLGARCRYCRAPISWRYFAIELVTACLWVALYHRVSGTSGVSWVDFVAQALFVSVLVAMIFIDLDHFIAPDELNIVAFILGLGRDGACLALAWYGGAGIWADTRAHFTYFGWLPRALVGATTYGVVLFLVSLVGFVYYARWEGESVGHVLRRYFIWEDEPEQAQADIAPLPETPDKPQMEAEEEPADDGPPPRLRFAPGFLALVSALLLTPIIGAWAALFLVIPTAAFAFMAPRLPNEGVAQAAARFFRSDEGDSYAGTPQALATPDDTDPELVAEMMLPPAPDEAALLASEREAQMRAEADQFAREAETGQHGGMGLGDVKLALAFGAMLGPALALLSLLFATFLGAGVGIYIARRHRSSLRTGVPFVPFMAAGAIIVMLYGQPLLDWYFALSAPAQTAPQPVLRQRHRNPRGVNLTP